VPTGSSIDPLDEPVRRYLQHALAEPAGAPDAMRLDMSGRIRVGGWLAFAATQELSADGFVWDARAGLGRLRPLHVVDRYRAGTASMTGRLPGGLRFLHADGPDTVRSAAVRAALERVWAPGLLTPEQGVRWHAEDEHVIVAALDVAPEHVELRLEIDAHGALRRVSAPRWGRVQTKAYTSILFGAEVHAERRFGAVVIPSAVDVGWWFGTPRYAPFLRATIDAARPLSPAR
jgi:hypothetical protein